MLVLALLGTSQAAYAQDDIPVDVEIIRPGLSPMGGFGVDAPHAIAAKTWSAGALIQYENTPLRLYDGEELVGPLVAHRTVLQLHAGISASKRTSFSLMIPVGGHFGSGDLNLARNGAGLGDAAVSVRVHIGPWKTFSLGVLGTVMLPTGNGGLYMGERLPRLRVGLLGYTDLGRVKLLTNLLAHVREPVSTVFDFTAGSELQIDLGVQGVVIPDELDLIGELVTRVGLEPDDNGGRLASEVVAGVRYKPRPGLRIDLAIGRGLTEGYGTTEIRGMLGVSFVQVPKPRPEPVSPIAFVEDEPLPEVEDPPPAPPPPPPPPPPPVAKLTGEQIEIRDPIEFEQGTTRLLDSSGPVLDGVAEVILGNRAVGHVVIEGHASAEGGYGYNYELSGQRARAIYEALILRGVHPKRLSYRGAGEVERVVEGDDEAARMRNRRVVFNVVRQYAPDESPPVLPSEVLLPWSGLPQQVVTPPEAVMPVEADPVAPQAVPSEEASEAAPTPVQPVAEPDPLDVDFPEPVDDEPVFDEPTPEPSVPAEPTPAEPTPAEPTPEASDVPVPDAPSPAPTEPTP